MSGEFRPVIRQPAEGRTIAVVGDVYRFQATGDDLDRVHEQVLRELPGLGEAELDRPVPHPYPFATTKLLAILWCAHNEIGSPWRRDWATWASTATSSTPGSATSSCWAPS